MEYSNVIYIILYFTIFIVLLLYIVLVYNRKNIIDNWDKYKCNPLVIPFAGFFGKNSSDALNTCLLSNFTDNFSLLFRPFSLLTTLVSDVLKEMIYQVNTIRYILKPIRIFIEQITGTLYKKIENIVNITYMSYLKMDNLTKRVLANFRLLVYSLEASQFTLQSTFGGPMMDIAKFWAPSADYFSKQFCFKGDTQIILDNGNTKSIDKIKIGDILSGGSKVLGLTQFKNSNCLVDNNGVIVSKYHIEYKESIYKTCEDYPITTDIPKLVYCLITSNNLIPVLGKNGYILTFCDYLESNNNTLQYNIRKIIYNNLGLATPITLVPNLLINIAPIKIGENITKAINKINIGDILYDGIKVLGVIKQYVDNIKVYNNYFTASIINLDIGSDYKSVNNVSDKYTGIMYNLVTDKGYFYVDSNIKIADYNLLVSDKNLEDIRTLTLNYLNLKL